MLVVGQIWTYQRSFSVPAELASFVACERTLEAPHGQSSCAEQPGVGRLLDGKLSATLAELLHLILFPAVNQQSNR